MCSLTTSTAQPYHPFPPPTLRRHVRSSHHCYCPSQLHRTSLSLSLSYTPPQLSRTTNGGAGAPSRRGGGAWQVGPTAIVLPVLMCVTMCQHQQQNSELQTAQLGGWGLSSAQLGAWDLDLRSVQLRDSSPQTVQAGGWGLDPRQIAQLGGWCSA